MIMTFEASHMSNILGVLQPEQRLHDEVAHRDILALTFKRRITHMALHYAKYAGRLLAMESTDTDGLELILVDTSIITLASANMLGLSLGRVSAASRLDLGGTLRSALRLSRRSDVCERFGVALAIQNANLAKACEAFDHNEDFPYEETISASVLAVAELVSAIATETGIDLAVAIRHRWESIEARAQLRANASADAIMVKSA